MTESLEARTKVVASLLRSIYWPNMTHCNMSLLHKLNKLTDLRLSILDDVCIMTAASCICNSHQSNVIC